MIVMIGGSRNFNDYDYLKRNIEMYNISKIISGGAKGADTLAEQYAKENNIPFECYPAEWNKYGKKAGIIRNKIMIDKADFCVFFWDGKSPGTKFSIEYAKKKGKKYIVFRYNEKTSLF